MPSPAPLPIPSPRILLLALCGLAFAPPAPVLADDDDSRYAAFRVVRAEAGEPGRPEITLPEPYALVSGDRYRVASRAEFYGFVAGPENREGIPVRVDWPDKTIKTVIASNRRLDLERNPEEPGLVEFRLPVRATSPGADQATLQVWSHMETAPGIRWRIEHNDPDRAAGPWTDVPWPENQARAAIHYLAASEAILRDSGLAETAAARGHFYALMGFETNNTLHPDNPPHWHLAYFAGDNYRAPAYLPHFWIDAEGRNFYNGMDVTGEGRQRLRAGDPGRMYDFDGNRVLTATIREDGGLDLDPPEGPRYSIVPGTNGDFVRDLAVERNGRPWLRILTHDDVRTGVLVIRVLDARFPDAGHTTVHTYDRLTGTLLESRPHPLSRGSGNRE